MLHENLDVHLAMPTLSPEGDIERAGREVQGIGAGSLDGLHIVLEKAM